MTCPDTCLGNSSPGKNAPKGVLSTKTNHQSVKRLAIAGILTALGVIGGTLSTPVGFTKCCPMQSIINVISAIFLGPWYSLGTGILSVILAWPIAIFVLGKACGPFTYFVPFMAAAVTGVVIASLLVLLMSKSGAMRTIERLVRKG